MRNVTSAAMSVCATLFGLSSALPGLAQEQATKPVAAPQSDVIVNG